MSLIQKSHPQESPTYRKNPTPTPTVGVISPSVSDKLKRAERDAVRRLHADEDGCHHAGRRVGLQHCSLPRAVGLVAGKSAGGIDSVYDLLRIIRKQHK